MSELNKEIMISSYRNISFYGEKRGAQEFEYYTELLESDLKELGENLGNYREKFIDKLMAYFYSQSNCASAFICGPANFNNRRAEKLFTWRDNKMDHFNHWRTKYFKAVNRVRTLSPEAEIDVAIERLEFLETEKAKPNKYTHKYLSKPSETPEDTCRIYSVTTKIRETKKKIEAMKHRIEAKNNFKPINFEGGKILLENDRLIIAHDEKPEREILDAIKKHGFRYSPKFKQWVRKHTGNARYSMELLLNNHLGGAL